MVHQMFQAFQTSVGFVAYEVPDAEPRMQTLNVRQDFRQLRPVAIIGGQRDAAQRQAVVGVANLVILEP